jgi:hypothetical protein
MMSTACRNVIFEVLSRLSLGSLADHVSACSSLFTNTDLRPTYKLSWQQTVAESIEFTLKFEAVERIQTCRVRAGRPRTFAARSF